MTAGHGYARYSSKADPCRCEVCRQAKADYMRRRREEAQQNALRWREAGYTHVAEGVTHGTRSAYEETCCRCTECVAFQPLSSRHRPSECAS